MNHPIAPLERLRLEDMPPTTRRPRPQGDDVSDAGSDVDHDGQDTGLDSEVDSADSEDEQQHPDQVRSPTRLVYNIEALPEKTKSAVRDAFAEPPVMVVQHCRQLEDTYAFQMTEVVTRSIRIRAPSSGRSRLSCSCTHEDNRTDDGEPCPHLLWLLDQVVKQTLYDISHEKPLTMTSAGYPVEIGDPFQTITDHHLNILADGLHCRVVGLDNNDYSEIEKHRIAESRELLASVYQAPPATFRSDIFGQPHLASPIIKHNDLDYTVFRMLVDDDNFFHYFLSQANRSDAISHSHRLLCHRVSAILRDLDTRAARRPTSLAGGRSSSSTDQPCTVAWAARHIMGVAGLVRFTIWSRERPLKVAEKESAAKTLLHILDGVVRRNIDYHNVGRRSDRNLYLRLIGDADDCFLLDELWMIPDGALPFVHTIDGLIEEMTLQGVPMTYATKLRELAVHLRSRGASASLKRQVEGQEGGESALKRMK